MAQVLSFAFMDAQYARGFNPANARSDAEEQAAREQLMAYRAASEVQRVALREMYGDALMDRTLAGTTQIEMCRAAGHFIAAWQDIETRDHHWQHGLNREHQLVMADAELATWPYADGPIGEWVVRVHHIIHPRYRTDRRRR